MTEQRIDLGLTSTGTGGCGSGCGCGHAASTPASAAIATDTLRVEGMTCEHCVRAVTEELSALDGVDVVDVELHAGGTSIVRIATTDGADDARLAAAIDEAGYTLVR
ncbi:heavy-metal-associated domain-containing protein [Microbacterium trichothecenolyticum]|uniref:Copper chaperone n=1 Tax=Microbacterium trichothecenolyticum TaxID=69370 RepID=A0ABU0U0L9_MICTR|nr:heavy-metal-associated domain-containing protein [Microbacterium trichothecenolyticum]MDQ1124729.1 copper chaperone [Microbacterium trichothecenolyticum]